MEEYPLWMGFALVIGLVAAQYGMRHFRQIRLKIWWTRANAAMEKHDLDKAIVALKKCLALFPLWVPARILLGTVQAMTGQLKEAEEQLKMASELEPKQPEGHLQLGLFYAAHHPEEPDKALDSFETALSFAPHYKEKLAQVPHLKGLKEHPRFKALIDTGEDPSQA